MSVPFHADERTGFLQIIGGINSEQDSRDIRAGLGDLAGVYGVEITGSTVKVRYVPATVSEQQFYQAIKTAGFRASGFQMAA
jgi:hypothetical protein